MLAQFVYDGAHFYTLDKVLLSKDASSTEPFMVERPELASLVRYQSGYLVAPSSTRLLGIKS